MQYKNITLKVNNKIIIVDRIDLYYYGASLKDLGNKCFTITKIENNNWIGELLLEINIKCIK